MSDGRMHHGSVSTVRVVIDIEAFLRMVAGEMVVLRGVAADSIIEVEVELEALLEARLAKDWLTSANENA